MATFNYRSKKEVIEAATSFLEEKTYCYSESMQAPSAAKHYMRLKIGEQEREIFVVLFLSSQHNVIASEEMFLGTIDGAAVYPREVVKAALRHNAGALILGHNHPSGVCEPSAADKRITERLQAAVSLVDIKILDHIICSPDSAYSFAEAGLL
jgi:DNA repair protein RadC